MTESVDIDYKDISSSHQHAIRYIPVPSPLKNIIHEQIQTQDVFHIRFYPDNNHLDIQIYEFLNYDDIYHEVKETLCDLNVNPTLKYRILHNLETNKDRITKNIQYFGVAHFLAELPFNVCGITWKNVK